MELGRRLKTVREQLLRQSPAKVARDLGVGKSSVIRYESGERLPDAWYLYVLSRRSGSDLTWLMTGQGSMLSAASLDLEILKEFETYRNTAAHGMPQGTAVHEFVEDYNAGLSTVSPIPGVDRITADYLGELQQRAMEGTLGQPRRLARSEARLEEIRKAALALDQAKEELGYEPPALIGATLLEAVSVYGMKAAGVRVILERLQMEEERSSKGKPAAG